MHVFRADPTKRVKDQKVGEWIMPKSEITRADGSLMSRKEIKEKFALPSEPTHIVDVVPDRPVRATVSRVAGSAPENGGISNHFGEGGGRQWRIQEKKEDLPADWFQLPRPLK